MVPLSKPEERIYGADVKIESISPIYIQFKRSMAYPDYSTAKIIKDRKILKANCSPRTLYFELRAKKPNHKDFQHNILFDLKNKLDKAGKGKAFYTAPLFLNRTAYLLSVHMSSLLSWRPWHWFRHDPFSSKHKIFLLKQGVSDFKTFQFCESILLFHLIRRLKHISTDIAIWNLVKKSVFIRQLSLITN